VTLPAPGTRGDMLVLVRRPLESAIRPEIACARAKQFPFDPDLGVRGGLRFRQRKKAGQEGGLLCSAVCPMGESLNERYLGCSSERGRNLHGGL